MSGKVANSIVRDGLVFYLDAANPLSYPRGGTQWTSFTKNQVAGTITGATYNTANAGSFDYVLGNIVKGVDGPNGLLSVGAGNTVTMEVVVKPAVQVGPTVIFGYGTTSLGFNRSYGIGIDQNNYLVIWYANIGATNIAQYTSYAWNTVTLVLGGSGNVYVNGVHKSTNPYTPGAGTGTYWTVGSDPSGTYPYSGSIAAVRVYNRELSQAEVTQNYNALLNRYR